MHGVGVHSPRDAHLSKLLPLVLTLDGAMRAARRRRGRRGRRRVVCWGALVAALARHPEHVARPCRASWLRGRKDKRGGTADPSLR